MVLPSITSFRHLKRIATTRGRARARREREKERRSREEEHGPPRGAVPLCTVAVASECCRRRASRREKEVVWKMSHDGGGVPATVGAQLPLLSWPPRLWLPGAVSWPPEPVFLGLSPGIYSSEFKAAVGPPELLAAHGSFVGAIRSRSYFACLSSGDFRVHKCCGGCCVIPFISEVVAELIRGAEAVSYIEKKQAESGF
ncbi:uncharacterized protein DS421_17g587770 [Arachis hypogaea]|nr:uncharacterized protein DS421_17g587770 [Arachis hypogaea]